MPVDQEPYTILQARVDGAVGACDTCGSGEFVRRPSPDPAAPLYQCVCCRSVYAAREPIAVVEPTRRWKRPDL